MYSTPSSIPRENRLGQELKRGRRQVDMKFIGDAGGSAQVQDLVPAIALYLPPPGHLALFVKVKTRIGTD